MNKPNGKVSIKFLDGNNNEFTENPFYVNANFMADNPLPNIDSDTAINRFKTAIYEMSDLTSASYISTKVTYEIIID